MSPAAARARRLVVAAFVCLLPLAARGADVVILKSAETPAWRPAIDALRKATETSYFKGPDAVWVKLVIPTAPQGVGRDQFGPSDTQASIVVRR